MTTLPPGTVRIDILGALDQLAVGRNTTDAAFKNKFLFARAAALDAAGRHAEAWETLVAANRPLAAEYRAELKAHIPRPERSLATLLTLSSRAAPLANSREQPVSLLILGPSPSGQTSLDRVVS